MDLPIAYLGADVECVTALASAGTDIELHVYPAAPHDFDETGAESYRNGLEIHRA